MAKKTHDLVVKVGEYEKNGETKNRYVNIGVMMQGDNGSFILLDTHFNPAGVPSKDGRILVSLYEPKEKNEKSRQETTQSSSLIDDEIPFN